MNNDNTQHDTGMTINAIISMLSKAGYRLEDYSEGVYFLEFIVAPDGSMFEMKSDSKNEAWRKAYAHLQQQQETERLRARVAELEAETSYVKTLQMALERIVGMVDAELETDIKLTAIYAIADTAIDSNIITGKDDVDITELN